MVDKAAANKAKNAGNIAFKAKDFDTAITSYNTAIELDPDEVTDVLTINVFDADYVFKIYCLHLLFLMFFFIFLSSFAISSKMPQNHEIMMV